MTLYRIAIPEIDEDTYQFAITIVLSGMTLEAVFKWIDEGWRAFFFWPDGYSREAGVYPNSVNWKGFPDYKVIFLSEYSSIPRIDISSCIMLIQDVLG